MERPKPKEKRVRGWLRALEKHRLSADGRPPPGTLRELNFLTVPRRDREAFELLEGADGKLRVWTRVPGFDSPTVHRAGMLLAQLIAEAGHPMPEGADILVTPKMGRDVFPQQWERASASGVYFRHDRYCAVRSNLPRRFREDVIRHELVHAYTLGPVGLTGAPRFVTEGLAEYLRFMGPRDGGCQIPPTALRDNLAYLDAAFAQWERMGLDLSRVSPRHLVHLSPREFYGLPLGYAAALAMHAYVGGEPVARTLRTRSPDPLVAALSGINWAKFRVWLKDQADGGDAGAASFVQDTEVLAAEGPDGATAWNTLRKIGALSAGNYLSILKATVEAMGAPDQIDAVIRQLLAPDRRPVIIATDLSRRMDRLLGSIAVPAALEEAGSTTFETTTPRDVVASVHGRLKRNRKPRITLVGIGVNTQPREHPRAVESYTLDLLPAWLDEHAASRMRFVFCTAQRRTRRSAERLSQVRDRLPTNAVVLVIDLTSATDSDGAYLARALAERGPSLHVAYWRP